MPTLGKTKVSPSLISTGSLFLGTSSYAVTASYAMNGGGGGSVQTGNIANQTILYNVTTSQDNTITGLNLSSNKWGVTVVEEWNSGSIVGDEYYNSCSLLLHFSGSNGSTTFTDNSPSQKTITANGTAQISTAQSKFGGSSAYFDGSGDYLTTTSNSSFAFGTGDYTIEAWVYPTTIRNGENLIYVTDVTEGTSFGFNQTQVFIGARATALDLTATYTVVANVWTHLTATRQSGTVRIFANGNLISSGSVTRSCPQGPGGIGDYPTANGNGVTGYIDEVRVTKGVARYTGSFVTQSAAFPDNLNVTQLQTKYVGLVGGINDSTVDYGVEKLNDTSLKIRKMTASGQPLSGSGALSASVDRVYVNVLDYTNVMVTSSYALTASYVLGGIQTGSISNQTILYNVTTSQDNTITGLDLSGNKWDVSVIEEWNSASIVGGDLYYSSCSLLLHFSGSNNSTVFIDNSPITKSVTAFGNAKISTTQSKFGSSSLYLDGTGDYLSTPSNNDFSFGTGDFTIECWIYLTAATGDYRTIIGISYSGGGVGIRFGNSAAYNSLLQFHTIGQTAAQVYSVNKSQSQLLNSWNHIAFTRTGTTCRAFVNGIQENVGSGLNVSSFPNASFTDSTNIINNSDVLIGYGGAAGTEFIGYIDELRITKGVARYTTNFTPQTSEFENYGNLNQLITKYIGLVGGLNDSNVDYGVEKLSDTSLKIRKMTASGQPLSGSGALSASVDRVYVNVLNYKEVQTTAQSASYAVTSSYTITSVTSSFALSASYLIPTSNNTTKAIFGYGNNGTVVVSMTNLVSNTGVVATDTTGVGTARQNLAAAGYGGDKAIFGYGITSVAVSMINLVSNTGVVANDTTGIGTAKYQLAATGYGVDKAIFGYGYNGSIALSNVNLVSNIGIVANNVTGVGTARRLLAAAGYGGDKAIFGYGFTSVAVSITNLVSNTGVVATDTTGVGTDRYRLSATGYGGDKSIFGYGYNGSSNVSMTNLVSNTGIVATDTTGVGTVRRDLAAAGYGSDKAIFGYGFTSAVVSITNLVSNTGVVATDTTGVGTARDQLAAAGYSTT
jgi:hypothetical protein